jgi:uncharacterized membrane protein YvlD (DUF360 family)
MSHYLSKNQFRIQSIVFWFVAFMHFSTDKFWYFATAAIIFTGIQDILEELRKSNKQENEQS